LGHKNIDYKIVSL